MADWDDLRAELVTVLTGALGGPVLTTGTRREEQIDRGDFGSRITPLAVERVDRGSNQLVDIATVDVEVYARATSPALANIATAENALANVLIAVARTGFWTDLTTVRSSPKPDVEISSEIERVGEVITATIRADVALEA